jgi:CMP-N-acetylneuraminic acid synthetase
MSTIACIFARAGSKGVPNKNIQLFNGRPLIAWAVEMALAINLIDQVYVSTDSEEIANIARSAGAIVPFIRPSELASDASPEWLSWQHFLMYFQNSNGALPEIFLSLPTTSPLRSINDIEKCIKEFKKGNADIVLGISRSNKSPYFNMVTKDRENSLNLVMNEGGQFARRQDTPEIFDVTTVCYVGNPNFIREKGSIFEGRVVGVEIPSERAIDIDTPLDFQIAEFLHKSMALE